MTTRQKLFVALTIIMVVPILSSGQEQTRARRQRAIEQIKYDVPEKIDINYEVLDNIDISQSRYGVVPLPESLGKTLNGLFSKYTKHVAPNGKPIHIFAQSGASDLQVVSIARTPRYPRYWAQYTYYAVTEPSGFGPMLSR